MKHISILVPKGDAALSTIEGPYIMFTRANDFLAGMGKDPMFNVQLVGLTKEAQVYDKLFNVYPNLAITDVAKTDLIIIPAVNGDKESVIDMNKDFFPWIVAQHKAGAEVASLCIGAFLLASTGLLNGLSCSTHWLHANTFRHMFPEILLVDERVVTDEHGIYTSGGGNSFWNLLLYLVEKYTSRDMAILATKYFALEIDRKSQSPFMIFKGQRGHEDEPIKTAQEFIEKNYQDKISVEQLANMLALGRRNFERRFKKATSNTVAEYIQRVKVEAAKMSLESSQENVTEVMYNTGYTDAKAFRTTFKKITGLSPVQYRSRYNRDMVQNRA